MDFAFYNADPPASALGRAVQPLRRVLRRLQRPYFNRLRDLITFLFHQQQEHARRLDDLTVHINAVDAAARHRLDGLQHRLDSEHSPLQPQAFTADYLALTRRLAQLEDLVIELHSGAPVKPPVPATTDADFASLLRRIETLEETVAQLTAASQLDTVLPLYAETQRRQVS